VAGALVGLFGGLVLGPNLVAFKREYSAAETRESTYMRAAFAYVSVQMFKDRPVAGFGFNQFNIANRDYLSDRSTGIRVESIRGYVHHNSFLSLLVDLGIVGFSLFGLMLAGFVRESWMLWRSTGIPDWARGLGLIALCLTSVHLIQMAFHEVSFSSIENGVLFGSFGLVLAAKRKFAEKEPNS
jgi:O-antigen ligase